MKRIGDGSRAGMEEACAAQCWQCGELGPPVFVSAEDGYHKHEGGSRPAFMHGRTSVADGRVCDASLIRFAIRALRPQETKP